MTSPKGLHRTPLRAFFGLLTLALATMFLGFGGTAAHAAEGDTYTVGAINHPGTINGSTPKEARTFDTGLMTLVGAGVSGYCIDIHTPTGRGVGGYEESSWSESGIKNLSQVTWILNNSFPQVTDVTTIAEKAGVTGKVTTNTVVAATQAAIWHYTDGFEISKNNSPAKIAIYNYLVNAAKDAKARKQWKQ